jgi:hypothetical protein
MIANSGIVNAAVFTCSICGEPSTNICAYCTKDACGNHRCERCKRCSDCCECDVPLSAEEAVAEIVAEAPAEVIPEAAVEPPPPFESSVFAEPDISEPRVFADPSVFAEPPDVTDPADHDGPS